MLAGCEALPTLTLSELPTLTVAVLTGQGFHDTDATGATGLDGGVALTVCWRAALTSLALRERPTLGAMLLALRSALRDFACSDAQVGDHVDGGDADVTALGLQGLLVEAERLEPWHTNQIVRLIGYDERLERVCAPVVFYSALNFPQEGNSSPANADALLVCRRERQVQQLGPPCVLG